MDLSEKVNPETSPTLTAYYSRASAGECSTSHFFCAQRGEMLRKRPGEARRSQEIIRKSFFQKLKIIISSTPQQQNVRIQILLISKLPAYRNAFLSIITLIYYRKNSQIECS